MDEANTETRVGSGGAGGVAQVGALGTSRDGGPLKAIGLGDRGSGLSYQEGRLVASAASSTDALPDGVRVVKVQPPLDNSDDARGVLSTFAVDSPDRARP